MPPLGLGAVLQHLGSALAPTRLTDRQLLERFARIQDQEAFEALLKRYAGFVMGVCRRVVGNDHDAEDVFQAVFLVLARRAGTVRWNESIGGWIYEVACRLALRARAASLRRRRHETQGIYPMDQAESRERSAAKELCAALDEELSRLPEKLRTPLALVYLDGQAREKVALQLGYSERTLKRRLVQGKRLLRGRLEKRGLTLSATLVAVGIASSAAEARIPASLLRATTNGAAAFSSGHGAEQISPRVLDLATRMLRGIAVSKTHVCLLVSMALGIASASAGLWARQLARVNDNRLAAVTQAVTGAAQQPDRPQQRKTSRVDRYGDPLPPGAIARLGTVRFRHEGEAYSVAYSPDGKTVAAASAGAQIFVWDAATGKELRRWLATDANLQPIVEVHSIEFSPDGKLLASRANDGALRLWDTQTSRQTHKIQLETGIFPGGIPAKIRFSPDGRMVAVPVQPGRGPQFVSFIDVRSGQEAFRLPTVLHGISDVAFSPDGTKVALDGSRPSLELCSVRTRNALYAFRGHEGNSLSRAVAFSPDGKILASGEEHCIILLEADTGHEIGRLCAPMTDVNFLTFTADGKSLISAAEVGGKIRIWDVASMKERRHLQVAYNITRSVALSPDGKTLAAGTPFDRIQFWDLASGRELFTDPESHDARIQCVAFSPDRRQIATGFETRQTALWDTATGHVLRKLGAGASALAFSPDGRRLATAWFYQKGIRIWDVATGATLLNLPSDGRSFAGCAYSPNGDRLIAHLWNNAAKSESPFFETWDTSTGSPIGSFGVPKPGEPYNGFAVTHGGETAAIWIGDRLAFWDVQLGKERYRKERYRTPLIASGPTRLVFLGDGNGLVVINGQNELWLLDVPSGKRRLTVHNDCGSADVVTVSPDGSLMAMAGTWDEQKRHDLPPIRVCELASGKEVLDLRGHGSEVTALAFSPDGKTLVSGLRNSTALLWSVVPETIPHGSLNELWSALGSENAAEAYRAQWGLADRGDAVPFLRSRLQPVSSVDAHLIRGLIADLDSAQFSVRESASRKLIDIGEQADPLLLKALADKPSADVRERIHACLAVPRAPGKETMRAIRAIHVLERIGSLEAQAVLKTLSGGAISEQTREAKAALGHLSRR